MLLIDITVFTVWVIHVYSASIHYTVLTVREAHLFCEDARVMLCPQSWVHRMDCP